MIITLSDADMARLTLIIRQETGNIIESRSYVTISSRIQSRMLYWASTRWPNTGIISTTMMLPKDLLFEVS